MDNNTHKLGIPLGRRLAGATFNLFFYIGAVYGIINSHSDNQPSLLLPSLGLSEDQLWGLVLLLVAIGFTPTILYPCCFDKFPDWLLRYYGEDKMSRYAHGYFGVDLDTQMIRQTRSSPLWVRYLLVILLAIWLLTHVFIVTYSLWPDRMMIVGLCWTLAGVGLFILFRMWRSFSKRDF